MPRDTPGTIHVTKERDAMPLLNPGDHFPPLTITPVDGEAIDLPDALAGPFAVIQSTPGPGCPSCNAELRAVQRATAKLDGLDVRADSLSIAEQPTAPA